jgi:hypothetical protein
MWSVLGKTPAMRMIEQRFFWALALFSLAYRLLTKHARSLSLAKDQNSSLPHCYIFSSSAQGA